MLQETIPCQRPNAPLYQYRLMHLEDIYGTSILLPRLPHPRLDSLSVGIPTCALA
jgi:hypothetical protein